MKISTARKPENHKNASRPILRERKTENPQNLIKIKTTPLNELNNYFGLNDII